MAFFVGDYIQDMRDMLVGSIISGINAALIGKVGSGKTEVPLDLAERITEGKYVFIEFQASSQPEIVNGYLDIERYLNRNEYALKYDGTPYQEGIRVVIADEFSRPGDIVHDAFVHAMSSKVRAVMPVFWLTANWMPTNERAAAMVDRIGMVQVVKATGVNGAMVVRAQLNGVNKGGIHVEGDVPTWAQIEAARNAVPQENAINAICDLIDAVTDETSKENFPINNRRRAQWSFLLFRVGFYYSGTDNFTDVPPEATRLLQWAYPTAEEDKAQKWIDICSVLEDRVQAAIELVKKQAFQEFEKIKASNLSKPVMAQQLGKSWQQIQDNLYKISTTDPRIDQTIQELSVAYANKLRGQ